MVILPVAIVMITFWFMLVVKELFVWLLTLCQAYDSPVSHPENLQMGWWLIDESSILKMCSLFTDIISS